MKQLEHEEQVKLMEWWKESCEQFGISEQLFFAIPNGGFRQMAVAKSLKEEGVRSGVPDLFLAHKGAFNYRGLFIEMKKPKGGRVSVAQKEMIALLKEQGYAVFVCNGWIEAKSTIETYLNELGDTNGKQDT